MYRKTTLALLFGIMAYIVQSQENILLNNETNIIPVERRIVWNPGIPGGIPLIGCPVEHILDHGADPTGNLDSWSAITSAINALPLSGGVVFIPEGTFRIGSAITIRRDRIVLMGIGRESKLMSESDGDCIQVRTWQQGSWQMLLKGANKGAIRLIVPDGSKFTTGEFAEIELDNDSLLMYTSLRWIQSWGENTVGQLFEIKSIQGNELLFVSPVNINFSTDLNTRIRPKNLVKHVGIENLYVEKMVENGNTFLFDNAAYCWIRNVESYYTRRSHVLLNTCLGIEIKESYFHRSYSYGSGGSGYGVNCTIHCTNSLIENNVFDSLRHSMLASIGANGNVFGYNYSIHSVSSKELNEILDTTVVLPDISLHGEYPFMNLFEGNEVIEIGIGDYWGPAGPGNTYFRNKVNGDGILYYDASHMQNVVGNITLDLTDIDNNSYDKLEHGNKINGIVVWDPDLSRDLPYSYYLNSAPPFFKDKAWPPFGPEFEITEPLPARIRYENPPVLEETESNMVLVYPNPCGALLQCIIQNPVNSIKLVDLQGQLIEIKQTDNQHHVLFDLSPYPKGIYILIINGDSGSVKAIRIVHM